MATPYPPLAEAIFAVSNTLTGRPPEQQGDPVAQMLSDPHGTDLEHGLDVIALARLFEDLNRWEDAALLYERGLKTTLPEADFGRAIQRLSALQRRRGDLSTAVRLWEQAAAEGHIFAHVELAKTLTAPFAG